MATGIKKFGASGSSSGYASDVYCLVVDTWTGGASGGKVTVYADVYMYCKWSYGITPYYQHHLNTDFTLTINGSTVVGDAYGPTETGHWTSASATYDGTTYKQRTHIASSSLEINYGYDSSPTIAVSAYHCITAYGSNSYLPQGSGTATASLTLPWQNYPYSKPTINAPSISNITTESAYASFTVANNGGATVTNKEIHAHTDSGLQHRAASIYSDSGTFEDLNSNTHYWVQASATNVAGTTYSDTVDFYTYHEAPIIANLDHSHTREGNTYSTTFSYDVIYDNTSYYSRQIDYGTTYGDLDYSAFGIKTISGLAPNTTYYYKITEVDDGYNDFTTGVASGYFLTPCLAPSNLSISLAGFTTSSISLNLRGTGDTNAPITRYTIYYKPKCDFTQEDVDLAYAAHRGEITLTPEQIKRYDSVGNNNGVVDIGDVAAIHQLIQADYVSTSTTSSSIVINELQEDTTYQFYVEATNAGGTTRSSDLYYFSTNLFEKDEYTRNIAVGEMTPFTVEITDDVTISINRDIVYSYTYVEHNNYNSIIDLTQGEEVTSAYNSLTVLGPQSVRAEITDSGYIAYMKITDLLSEKGWYTIHTGDFITPVENMRFGIRKVYTLGGKQDHSAYFGEGNVCRFYYSPNDMKDYYFWIAAPGDLELTEPITIQLNNITFKPFKYTSVNPGHVFTDLAEETEYKFYAAFTIQALGINAHDYWHNTTLTVTTPPDQAKIRLKTEDGWQQGKTYLKINDEWVKAKKIYKKIEGQWIIGTNN